MKALSEYSYMVVDDVRSTRIKTQCILKTVGVEEVWHSENGHEALSTLQLNAKHVDCIITDFNMPVMHGLKMVKQIRMGHETIPRDIPILMLTGYGDQNLLGVAMALDVNAFLLKSCGKDMFIERLQTMMQTQESSENWLKPKESYLCIDSDTMIKSILEKPQVDIESKDPKRDKGETEGQQTGSDHFAPSGKQIEKAIDIQHKRHRSIRNLREESSNIRIRVSPPPPPPLLIPVIPQAKMELKQFPLELVPLNSILAKDLMSNRGIKLLGTNTLLTKGMIERLKDLKNLGERIDTLYVQIEKEESEEN